LTIVVFPGVTVIPDISYLVTDGDT
jgi:hypothetical protein